MKKQEWNFTCQTQTDRNFSPYDVWTIWEFDNLATWWLSNMMTKQHDEIYYNIQAKPPDKNGDKKGTDYSELSKTIKTVK